MTEQLVWLFAFFALYAGYCVYWGVTSARMTTSSADFFLADRQIPAWVFVLAATAMSFTGLTALGLPSMIFRDGFQFAPVALCAITIPLTGVLFLKRQWILGKRFGFVTPAEMFSAYFGGHIMRLLVLLIALAFALPFLGMQLAASGYLIQVLSDGTIPWVFAMWVLTAIVFLYVCFGGLRAVAYVGTLQCLLFAAGVTGIGLVAYGKLGGFGAFVDALGKLGATKLGAWQASSAGYNAYFATPGVIQFVGGLGKEAPVGGLWTATMVLSYCLALMGIQAAPHYTIWAFGARDPKGYAPQQVWASAAAIGVILVFFAVVQGMGAHFLGASAAVTDAGLAVSRALPPLGGGDQASLIGDYIKSVGAHAPWFLGLLAVSAVAAIQATASILASATGTMFARDFYKHFLVPAASDRQLKLFGRIGVGLTLLASLMMATFVPRTEIELGALALGFGLQLVPSMTAICWTPWITRRAAVSGLLAGLVAVVMTENLGTTLAIFVGVDLPWGRWPWTIHSAGWGIVLNVAVTVIVSLLSQNKEDRERRMEYHAFLREMAALSPAKRGLRPVAWSLMLAWLFFAIGPGLVVGTDFFGPPNAGTAAWALGIPSVWIWLIVWWALGILVIWFLAYKLDMSRPPTGRIEPRPEGIRTRF